MTLDRSPDELVNKGIIMNRPGPPEPGGRTFIVTGLHRSGTSLVASILRRVGIFMGSEINDNVHEDEEIVRIMSIRDRPGLKRLIRGRAANYGTWGFKFPMLCGSFNPRDLALFGNPHVIVTFRDPISIAVRNTLSEYQEPMKGLRAAVDEQNAMLTFIERLRCPALLLSYEKSIIFPGDFVDAIIGFCGLPANDLLREGLLLLVDPNRTSYIAQARRRYEGVIDGMTGGLLGGWCRLTGANDPVELELLVDDQPVTHVSANEFRQDLLDAGIGDGNHAFVLDVRELGLDPNAMIRMKVARHGVELRNSGRRLDAYDVSSNAP